MAARRGTFPPMSTAPARLERLLTAEDLLALGDSFFGELVDGRLVEMSPAGPRHGRVEVRIASALLAWCRAQRPDLDVVAGEVGFVLARHPDVVRGADVAVLARERVDAQARGFVEGAPDVAIEVLSPSNSAAEIERKVQDYFGAGGRSVWLVDPDAQSVVVYHSLQHRDVFGPADTVIDPALPGFASAASELFE